MQEDDDRSHVQDDGQDSVVDENVEGNGNEGVDFKGSTGTSSCSRATATSVNFEDMTGGVPCQEQEGARADIQARPRRATEVIEEDAWNNRTQRAEARKFFQAGTN